MRRKKDEEIGEEASEEVSEEGGGNKENTQSIPITPTVVQVPSHNCFMEEKEFVALIGKKVVKEV